MSGIRAALVARGSSLREWAHAWATAHGEHRARSYQTLRMAIARRLDAGEPPRGDVALRLVRALRADLGSDVVPDFGERGQCQRSPIPSGARSGAATPRGMR